MLRRRIFSAAMASVMALSSVAVVAQAEETTNKVVTEAELKELITVTYGDAWRVDELKNYGPVTTERVYNALEAADTILNDPDSDKEDWTVAYQMVEAVMDTLYNYTMEELKDLIKEAEKILAKYPNNIFNEELQDQVYTSESFSNLEEQLDFAKSFTTSTSPADITTAYETLDAAIKGLDENPQVTKSDFRAVLKQYNEIIDNEYAYDAWRRGSGGWVAAGVYYGGDWILQNSVGSTAYGHLYNTIAAAETNIVSAYDTIDAIKGLTVTTDADIYNGYMLAKDAIGIYNSWTADSVNKSTKAGLAQLIDDYHGQLVYEYAKNELDDLLSAIETAIVTQDADATAETMGTDAADGSTATDDLWNTATVNIKGYAFDANDPTWQGAHSYDRLVTAEAFIKLTTPKKDAGDTDSKFLKMIYVPLNDAGYYDSARDIVFTAAEKKADGGKFQTISVGSKFDLSKLIDITGKVAGDDMDSAENNTADNSDETAIWGANVFTTAGVTFAETWDWGVSLEKAMEIAEIYLYEDKDTIKDPAVNPIKDIDTKNTIAVKTDGTIVLTAQAPEYQMAYRYLYYALTEKYEGSVSYTSCDHTKADVKKLINDAWDLIEDTGDAAIFNDANVALAEARQDAMNWVAAADSDRLYKEYTAGKAPMDKDGDGEYDSYDSSTAAYHALEAVYGNLLAEYNALKYSFGEIYEEIYKVAQKIDNGDLEPTKELVDAMHATALALSDIDPITYTVEGDEYEDNYAFDELRYFMPINRVVTNTGDGVSIDTIATELGVTAASVTTKDGKNPTHAALASAYAALIAAQDQKAADKGMLGDVNGDKKVTPADASMILKAYVGLEVEGYNADVADFNEDGKVTPADAADILKAYVS